MIQRFRGIEAAELFLRDGQDLSDQRLGIGDFLVAAGGVGSQLHRPSLNRIGAAQMDPVVSRKAIKGREPFPVAAQRLDCLGVSDCVKLKGALSTGSAPRRQW